MTFCSEVNEELKRHMFWTLAKNIYIHKYLLISHSTDVIIEKYIAFTKIVYFSLRKNRSYYISLCVYKSFSFKIETIQIFHQSFKNNVTEWFNFFCAISY